VVCLVVAEFPERVVIRADLFSLCLPLEHPDATALCLEPSLRKALPYIALFTSTLVCSASSEVTKIHR
jgi:hypothetical protein